MRAAGVPVYTVSSVEDIDRVVAEVRHG
jgi:hypothetical protein